MSNVNEEKDKTATCSRCKENQPLDNFNKNRSKWNGRQQYCRPCQKIIGDKWVSENKEQHRNSFLRRRYGLKPGEYEAMLDEQGGVCYLCRTTGKTENRKNSFHVDHDHVTGSLRKILCASCNAGLGQLNDDPDLLRKAADYIEAHKKITAEQRKKK